MSDELLNSIALWIAISTFAAIVGFLVMIVVHVLFPRPGTVERRRERQRTALDKLRSETLEDELEIDWFDFRDLTEGEIAKRLRHYNWEFRSEEITRKSWFLRFTRGLASAAAADRAGHDTTGEDASVQQQAPQQEPPKERLADSARVASRAAKYRAHKGFDPSSEKQIRQARERDEQWQRKLNRQVLLASVYTIVLFILLAFLLSADSAWYDNSGSYVVVAIPVIVGLLDAIAVYKAARIQTARRADTRPILRARQDLVSMWERDG